MALKMPQHYKCYNILSSLPRNLGLYKKLAQHHNLPVSKQFLENAIFVLSKNQAKKHESQLQSIHKAGKFLYTKCILVIDGIRSSTCQVHYSITSSTYQVQYSIMKDTIHTSDQQVL